MIKRRILFFVIIIGALIFAGCQTDDEDDGDTAGVDDYIGQGKKHLEQNESLEAQKDFEKALSIKADSHEGRFGLFLARIIRLPNLIDQIIGTISSISFENQANDRMTKSAPAAPVFDNTIHEYLYENVGGRLADNEDTYELLAAGSDFDFELDYYTIAIDESALMTFSGHYDQCDLYFMGALDAVMNGLMNFLLALNLDFDPTLLILPDTETITESDELILAYLNLVESLLVSEVEPNFLYYREDGMEYLSQAGIDLGNAFARLNRAFDCMASAPLNRMAFQFHYFDRNADDVYTPFKDPVYIGDELVLSPDTAGSLEYLAEILPEAFYEGSEVDADPHTVTTITPAHFDELLYSLDLLPLKVGPVSIDGLPEYPAINLGAVFNDPEPDALRNMLLLVVDIVYAVMG